MSRRQRSGDHRRAQNTRIYIFLPPNRATKQAAHTNDEKRNTYTNTGHPVSVCSRVGGVASSLAVQELDFPTYKSQPATPTATRGEQDMAHVPSRFSACAVHATALPTGTAACEGQGSTAHPSHQMQVSSARAGHGAEGQSHSQTRDRGMHRV